MPESTGAENSVGVVVSLKGHASASSQDGTRELSNGSDVFEGDKITTSEDSQLEIKFADNTSLSQAENSEVNIDAYVYDADHGENSNLLLQMTKGVFRTITGEIAKQNPDNFNLKSPMALIGIRGTTVVGEVSEDGEKWGVEDIGKGHVLVVQDAFGNIQFISEPALIIDFFKNQPIDPARELTPKELDFFKTVAPITELQDQEDADPNTENPEGFSQDPNDLTPDPLTQLDPFSPPPVQPYTPPDQGPIYSQPERFNDPYTPNRETFNSDNDDTSSNDDPPGPPGPPPNYDPVATDDSGASASTDQDTAITIDVLSNDSDPEGSIITISSVSNGSNGTVVDNGDGTVTYTPNIEFFGQDSFEYTIIDESGATDTATVNVTVTFNDAPIAQDDEFSTDEDTPLPILSTLLDNDSDPNSEDSFTITQITDPPNGSVGFINNILTYTPDENFNGQDSFTYTIEDEYGATDTATVFVSVNPINDAPVAIDDTASTTENTAVIIDVIDNDSDIEGPIFLYETTIPENGSLRYNDDGTITYTPDENFNGPDSFEYTIIDEDGGTDTAIVTVDVNYQTGTNDNDILFGTLNADVINGFMGDDTIYGLEDSDRLLGDYGNDFIDGGDGFDTLIGGAGNDNLHGGDGILDVADYQDDPSGIVANMFDGYGNVTDGWDAGSGYEYTDYLDSVEWVIGSHFNDTLNSDSDFIILEGSEGNDTIRGDFYENGGETLVSYWHDTFDIDGDGTPDAGTKGITINLNDINDDGQVLVTDGYGDTDTLSNIQGILGSQRDDTLTGTNGEHSALAGGQGDDSLNGGSVDFSIPGSDGNAAIYVLDQSGVTVELSWDGANLTGTATDGWENTDTLSNINSVVGSQYNDTLTIAQSTDNFSDGIYNYGHWTLNGWGGDDILTGWDGGNNEVRVEYSDSPDDVWINLFDADLGYGYAYDGWGGMDELHHINGVIGSDNNDTILAAGGSNRIDGEDEYTVDTVSYEQSGSGHIEVNMARYNPEVILVTETGYDTQDELTDIEYIRGTSGNDSYAGDGRWMIFEGGEGDDQIDGGVNPDNSEEIGVSYWNDTFDFDGDGTPDAGTKGITINLNDINDDGQVLVTDGYGDTDTLENIHGLMGSQQNDTLIGEDNVYDWLMGGQGDDTLDGGEMFGGGDDMIYASAIDQEFGDNSNTAIYVLDPNGVIVHLSGDNPDTIQVEDGYAVDGWGDNDTLNNINMVVGSEFNDSIFGNNQMNVLDGADGTDTLQGFGGNDYFTFTDTNSVDTILDFTADSVGGENDILLFDSENSEFQAEGTNDSSDIYTAANSADIADPTAYKVIGINDMVSQDWSDLLNILNGAINFETANEFGTTDDSYLIVSNGTDSRGYFWEGDTNNDDAVNDFELRQFVELQDFSDTQQTPLLGEENFEVA